MSDNNVKAQELELEDLRARIGDNLDQLAHRLQPKTIIGRQVETTKAHFVDTEGAPRTDNIVKVAGAVVGAIVVLAIIRKIVR